MEPSKQVTILNRTSLKKGNFRKELSKNANYEKEESEKGNSGRTKGNRTIPKHLKRTHLKRAISK